MEPEFQKFVYKVKNGALRKYEKHDAMLPLYTVEDEGPRILVILDAINQEDYHSGRLLDNDSSGTVFKNLITFVTQRCGNKVGKILVVNYEHMNTKRVISKNEGLLPVLHKSYKKRINALVKRYKPDRILIMGKEPTKWLAPHKLLVNHETLSHSALNGRVRKIKFGAEKYSTVTTHSLSTVSNDFQNKYEDLKVYPNLLGEVGHHFQNAAYGKNRYTVNVDDMEIEKVYTLKQFKLFYRKLKKARKIGFDTEGANLQRIGNTLLTMQFSFDGKKGYFLPFFHPQTPFTGKELKYIAKKLKWWFERGTSKYLIGAHLKYDLMQVKTALKIRWNNHSIYDIAGGEYCLDENRKFRSNIGMSAYSLEQLAVEYGCFAYLAADGSMSKGERSNMKEVPLERIVRYGIKDVVVPWKIHECQLKEAKRRGDDYAKFEVVVSELLSDIVHHFAVMEVNGIPVDRSYLVQAMGQNSEFIRIKNEINAKLKANKNVQKANANMMKDRGAPTHTLIGASTKDQWVFDINNVESQQELFFKVLKLKILEERKTGGGKINKPFQRANKDVEEVKLFTEYQQVNKMKSTFIDGFFKKITTEPDMSDGRLRPNFLILPIITGRAGAEKPSLQQLPEHGSLASAVKRQLIPSKGNIFLKADFSAHEVRNWGLIAGDDLIANSFRIGMKKRQTYRLLKVIDAALGTKWADILKAADIHRVNYEFFFGVKADKVTKEQRQNIKGVVFGVMYGMGPVSLAKQVGCSEDEARKLIKLLFEKFEVGGDWIKNIHKKGLEDLIITSPLGRVRHLWGYMHHDNQVHGMMNRRGPNSIVQGTSSDEGFIGGRLLSRMKWELFESQGQPFSMQPLNAVHDSTESEVAIGELPIACYLTEHSYTSKLHERLAKTFDFKLNVGLEMEMGIGPNLGKIDKYDFRKESLLKITEESVKWMNDNLRHDLNHKKIMRMVEHNADICDKLRKAEVRAEREIDVAPIGTMTVNRKNALDMGFKFVGEREVIKTKKRVLEAA